ncbi:hypothetical protein IVIADoCa2_14 [Xanthomonas phage vB_Xar_IVIA-DoCa2]|uniref:Uncharacterized protein n=1 Tax=Xanthomonas phage vB_Xar_IVIA-DoCa2 TaxID=2970491 RepID=A0A976SGV9_9CAUD|nr:hypothetical protein IVIADoCa2_14 [Xanthomonas phage vB_Xar_IVIA-DoCa2]
MSARLGSWIEVTIPSTRMSDDGLREALDNTVAIIGGATLTEGRGFYVRNDNGSTDYEHVIVVRWDFNIQREDIDQVMAATRKVVDTLLELGEECVLRRRHYGPVEWAQGGYTSELIFGPTKH